MLSQEIRKKFLQYFKNKGHAIVPSSPVVPHDDPTLLFTNAGMNQFKDVFLGNAIRDYNKASTSQKCIRVGGKHNDLENVGHTARHLTFFEMLGNFSFGDYFKKEAIAFAWEVSTEVFGFDADKIWPSVFREDDEAFELWKAYVPESRITRLDEKDNFWAMGETGPCGPCSELYYDRGEKFGSAKRLIEDQDGKRYLEFWNLVFMQFNRSSKDLIAPLPKPSIDTGAGLERIISLKMNVDSVFETDILRDLIAQVEDVSKVTYNINDQKLAPAFRVIVDHLRCLSFAIADGVQPSNIDRGYVLRKVLRRAVRYGRMLGMDEPFLAKILPRLISSMGDDYKELKKAEGRIAEILSLEEESFLRTLKRGGGILNQIIDKSLQKDKIISGDDAFKLKDTYGLPFEEISLIAIDSDLKVDEKRFLELEQEAKTRSRSSQKNVQQIASENFYLDFAKNNPPTEFIGYNQKEGKAKIKGILVNGQFVNTLNENEEGSLILDSTPFYAEMGGQVGDTGLIQNNLNQFSVQNCSSPYKGIILHTGKLLKGHLKVDDTVEAIINQDTRQSTENNHTATHLLHWALHHVLGEHVKQAGSVVDQERLRFDFSHHKPLSQEEISRIEDLINEKIRTNKSVATYEMPYDEAVKKEEIKQFFGEKYGSVVRVVDIDYSKELCGGTHTSQLGNIGYFRIVKESSIAAGVRRIEAVTGAAAENHSRNSEKALETIANLLKTPTAKLEERLQKLVEENKQLAQELKTLQKAKLENFNKSLIETAVPLTKGRLVVSKTNFTAEELKECADTLIEQLQSGVVLLTTVQNERVQLMIRISDDLVANGMKAQEIIKTISPIIEGNGGGKPNGAQASGKAIHRLDEAIALALITIKKA